MAGSTFAAAIVSEKVIVSAVPSNPDETKVGGVLSWTCTNTGSVRRRIWTPSSVNAVTAA